MRMFARCVGLLSVVCLLGGAAGSAPASGAFRRVELQTNAPDVVGRELVRTLEAGIRRSPDFVEAASGERMIVIITTLNPDPFADSEGTRTVYSIVWSFQSEDGVHPRYLASMLGSCDRARLEAITASILEALDRVFQNAS